MIPNNVMSCQQTCCVSYSVEAALLYSRVFPSRTEKFALPLMVTMGAKDFGQQAPAVPFAHGPLSLVREGNDELLAL
jgi:hypothetical protein